MIRREHFPAPVRGALLLLVVCTCSPGYHRRSMGGIDARAVAGLARPSAVTVPTGVYRGLVARSLYSQCRMFPSDSELFDRRVRACGAASAAALGVARLLLEVEASAEVLPVTFVDRRLRWLDVPPRSRTCAQ